MTQPRWLPSLALLALASLACRTLFPTALPHQPTSPPALVATTEPRPSATLGPAQPTLSAASADTTLFAAAMRPEFTADVTQFPEAARYDIDVVIEFNTDGTATLTGRERVRYTNRQDFALPDLYLMLWPNDKDQYLSDMLLRNVRADGVSVEPELRENGVAARLALAQPLAPGASVEVTAEFVVNAYPGVDADGTARFGLTTGVLLAPTFYPLVPRLVAGEWQIAPPPPCYCDTTNSDTAFYRWTVTAPAGLAIVGTGSVVEEHSSGEAQTQTLVTGPVRDLALVVGPLQRSQRVVDGITLNAYMLAGHASLAATMLGYVATQVQTLTEKVGPYPYAELDVVDAPGAFGGIEYPGEVFIGVVEENSQFFEIATVHEVGHQWFYGLIGDDQIFQPWLDEAAATYTEVLYTEAAYGAEAKSDLLRYFQNDVDRSDNATLPIGLGVADYTFDGYGAIVYQKGGLFFERLRRQLGDEVFFAFLRAYFADYRYGFASSADFQRSAETACGCALQALFDAWVYKGGPLPE